MRYFLLFFLGLISLYDGFTTVIGTADILEAGAGGIVISIVFAIFILAIMISTSFIFGISVIDSLAAEKEGVGCFVFILRLIWLAAFFYDIYTSYSGNKVLVIGDKAPKDGQEIILIGLTFLVSASPILVSFLISPMLDDD